MGPISAVLSSAPVHIAQQHTELFLSWSTDTDLCLDVERDEAVCHQVVDGLKPLLSDKVLPVMVETKVSRLVPKPGELIEGEGSKTKWM